MHKYNGIIFTIISLVLCSIAMLFAEKAPGPLIKGEISAERLWKRIADEDDYHKYSYWPNHKGLQPGRAPHGPFHKIFVNSMIMNAMPISNKIIPDGGIIIKEAYDIDKEFVTILVMAKVKDYNKDNQDWFWAQYTPEGKPVVSGKVETCISCHSAFKNNNCVIAHKLDE